MKKKYIPVSITVVHTKDCISCLMTSIPGVGDTSNLTEDIINGEEVENDEVL